MLNQRARETAYRMALLDTALLGAAFGVAFDARNLLPIVLGGAPDRLDFPSHLWVLLLAVPLFWILAGNSGLYASLRGPSYLRLVWLHAKVFVYLGLASGLAIFLLQAKNFSRAVFLLFLGTSFLFILAARILLKREADRPRRRAGDERILLIVGVNEEALSVRAKLDSQVEYGVRVVGHLLGPGETTATPPAVRLLGEIGELKRIIEEWIVDEVVFALPVGRLLACEREIAWCEEVGVTAHLKVDFVRTLFAKSYPSDLEGTPMLTLASAPRDPVSLALKRALDLAGSASAVTFLSPLFVICALGIKLTSRGPVFFRQQRVGLNGRIFTLLKFRSMHRDAEQRRRDLEPLNEMSGPVFKIKRDPRITPVGRMLRRFSLDELPQFFNVLRGDLSLVGPRPPLPGEVQRYERWQRRRLSVKPGMTCLWQISGRNKIGFEDWMKMDLAYIDNWSLKGDLKILLRTVPAVVLARGAE